MNQADHAPFDAIQMEHYVQDLRSLLHRASFLESKTFLGTFIRRIDFDKEQVGIEYTLPIPAGDGLTATKELLNVRGDGSPIHPSLRKWVWAWFKYPPSELHSRLPSTKLLRRNPLALAIEWQERLDKGEAVSRADLAYKMKVTRAHVTQALSLLDLASDTKELILTLGEPLHGKGLGIHSLRSLLGLSAEKQIARVRSSEIG